jgi:hypothetical protein
MIQPVLALIAWSLLMLVWLYVGRLPTLVRHALFESEPPQNGARRLPPQAQWPADNYNNLLEQPTLFYALSLGVYLGGLVTPDLVYLAWLYVGLRVVHSVVQATRNIMVVRLCLFIASSAVLGLMCAIALKAAFHF